MNYIKLLDLQEAYKEGRKLSEKIREKARTDPENEWAFPEKLEPALIPTKKARSSKSNTMSLRKHRKYGGHAPSGSHNPRIKEAMKREAEANSRPKSKRIRNPKSSIKELFHER